MLDVQIVLWLIVALTITTITWNSFAIHFSKKNEIVGSKFLKDRPLTRWWLSQMRSLVRLETGGILLLAIVQLIRNAFFVALDEPESWLVVVVVQIVLFFALSSLPATYLYVLGWGIKAVDEEWQGKLDASARAFLELHRHGWEHLEHHEEGE